jgi:hypothetical protein
MSSHQVDSSTNTFGLLLLDESQKIIPQLSKIYEPCFFCLKINVLGVIICSWSPLPSKRDLAGGESITSNN